MARRCRLGRPGAGGRPGRGRGRVAEALDLVPRRRFGATSALVRPSRAADAARPGQLRARPGRRRRAGRGDARRMPRDRRAGHEPSRARCGRRAGVAGAADGLADALALFLDRAGRVAPDAGSAGAAAQEGVRPARPPAARAGAGGGLGRHAHPGADRRLPRRPVRAARRGPADRAVPAADARGVDALEPRPARRGRAGAVPAARGVRAGLRR